MDTSPRPIVTVEMLDWWTPNSLLALPLAAMSKEEIDHFWVSPNTGIAEYLNQVHDAFAWVGISNPPPWEFRGIRWDRSSDHAAPDLLPGETFVPGGLEAVGRMLLAVQIFEKLKDANAVGDDEPFPHERPWTEITNAFVGALKDRLEAIRQPA